MVGTYPLTHLHGDTRLQVGSYRQLKSWKKARLTLRHEKREVIQIEAEFLLLVYEMVHRRFDRHPQCWS
jgi:hypothetical protein